MKVLLIGNYLPDRQQSMLRYAQLIEELLQHSPHEVRLELPPARLDSGSRGSTGIWKWVGYIDKFVLAPPALQRAARWADVVHICDHSNSMYVPKHPDRPYVVTTHDLLALRGALGEQTDCPASVPGKYLQQLILAGLKRASAILAVSEATQADVTRLVGTQSFSAVMHSPLNFPFRILPAAEVDRRLRHLTRLADTPFVLLVGSGLKRKNRDCAIRVLSRIRNLWPGRFVFAGEPLSMELRRYAASLGVEDRIMDVERPSGEVLEALYNRALAFLFPSRFEGFGWPLIEAQACGCPVVASNAPPHPEVTGGAALLCSLSDETTFDAAVLKLANDPALRDALITAGAANTARFDREDFAKRLFQVYESLV